MINSCTSEERSKKNKKRLKILFSVRVDFPRAILLLVGMLFLIVLLPSAEAFQNARIIRPRIAVTVRKGLIGTVGSNQDFPRAARLGPNRETTQILKQAQRLAEKEDYESAIILWQRVLDSSDNQLVSLEGDSDDIFKNKYRRYETVSRHVERSLVELPRKVLASYRSVVDGDAGVMLNAAVRGRDERQLGAIVRRYFLSSHGDEAAYLLASLRYDRGDYVGASTFLTRILDDYPDANVKRTTLLFRLAVINAKLGDLKKVETALAKLKIDSPDAVSALSVLLARIEGERSSQKENKSVVTSASWRMELGGPSRNQVMPAFPWNSSTSEMTELWEGRFHKTLTGFVNTKSANAFRQQLIFNGRRTSNNGKVSTTVTSAQMVDSWKKNGWVPCGRILFEEGRVYYKTENCLVCRELNSGAVLWKGRQNRFELDPLTTYRQMMAQTTSKKRPLSISEVQIFGDRISQEMTLSNQMIFNLEGAFQYREAGTPATQAARLNRVLAAPTRERTNWLAAYDAVTGKLKWYRGAEESEEASGTFERKKGFLAAPVSFRESLLIPVCDNGELWMHALRAADGKTLWKAYLCDEPPDGSSHWIPVGISVEGGFAYVATGTGLIFSLEADSGAVQWATRYRRSGELNKSIPRRGPFSNTAWTFDGWEQDMAIPVGNRLVVFASDYDHLFVVDRRDGKQLWESPRRPSPDLPPGEYCLGVSGDGVYVAGKNVVRRYGLSGGRMDWQLTIDGSLGRGMLTENAVCVPEGENIVQIDLETGKRKSQTHLFSLGEASEPVGNLYSDGERIMILGMGRVAVLTDLGFLLENLEKKIRSGDGNASLTRMQLHLRLGESERAFEDFERAFHILKKTESREKNLRVLYEAIERLELIQTNPQIAVKLIAESEEFFAGVSSVSEKKEAKVVFKTLQQERDQLLQLALTELRDVKAEQSVASILKVVSFVDDYYIIRAAQRAITNNVTSEDRALLQAALESEIDHVRLAAVPAIPKVFGRDAAAHYDRLLTDRNMRLRLTVALALANRGERRTLPILTALLNANDPAIRAKSARNLQVLTGQRFGFVSYAPLKERSQVVAKWNDWIEKEGQTAKLRFPIDPMSLFLGRTLVCDKKFDRVVEYDASGHRIWTQRVAQPTYSQGLPNGHRLIVSSSTQKIILEYDGEGKEVWRLDKLPSSPYSAQRLPNGNTLVAFDRLRKVVEYTPEKSVVWEVKLKGDPRDARRLDNGNTLITQYFGDSVIEVDRLGKVVWQATNLKRPQSAQRLENGNTLVSQYYLGRVVELDRDGTVVWSKSNLGKAYHAQRLPNGNTLICSSSGVQEFDPKGKTVWKQNGDDLKQAYRF